MSIRTPHTLEELSRQALLRNEALAISALEKLPIILFPALFKEAFNSRCTGMVKAMVVAWPFPYLRVRGMMNTFNSEIFHAVLDGLDVLVTQQVCPMRGELRVLDFRRLPCDFKTIQAGTEDGVCSAETVHVKQAGKPLLNELRPRIKVRVDLYFRSELEEEEMYFLQWARQRKDSLQLCCEDVKIVLLSLDNVRKVLSVFKPKHIKVLELSIDWSWCTLAQFSTYLPKMRNLHTLYLVYRHENRFGVCGLPRLDENKFVQKLASQFSGLSGLQHLYLRGFCFFSEHVKLLLSQCSQLTKVNFYSNDFSMNFLRDLFYHTANMSKMIMEQYPAPRECYDEWENISIDAFSQLCSQLMDTLRAIRQPKRISFATYLCDFCSQRCVYDQVTRRCPCLQ
ncbi:PRAME family member 10 [Microtus ochrogaster]|uniref:PRAME family member 10 n=1 Tax=Microtus ochrogaster TaxID=79684 RepID=A0A8J6G4H9_MICOH|nr:PRAME family member 10 [Microtus ochrogaster]